MGSAPVGDLASDFLRLFALLPAHRHSSGRPFTCCITFVFGMVRDSVPPVAARVRQPFSPAIFGVATVPDVNWRRLQSFFYFPLCWGFMVLDTSISNMSSSFLCAGVLCF